MREIHHEHMFRGDPMLDLDQSQAFPRISRASFQEDSSASVKKLLLYLNAKICPLCQGSLKIDYQPESTFAFCDRCHEFDVSIHLDLETKEVLLGFSSLAGPEGFVDPEILASLGSVLLRKEYSSLT